MDAGKLFLLTLFLMLNITICTSIHTLAMNQSLRDGDLLISKRSRFALGFFSPGSSGSSGYRYLGIWYHKVREPTVVWVANRNKPINGSMGMLSINQYGNFILYGDQDRRIVVWSTNVSVEVIDSCEAQLWDSGNLVLVHGRRKRIAWESFDYPTDNILPGMKVGLDRKTGLDRFLTSWRSADDPGMGDHSFKLNSSGLPQFFLYRGTKTLWRTIPWPWKRSEHLYNYSFINSEDGIYFSYLIEDDSLYIRAVLEHTGLLKRVRWDESEGQWKQFGVIQYLCQSYGHCGAHATCDPKRNNINDDYFECTCLPGYEPKTPRNWRLRDGSGGCVRKRLNSSSLCGHGEGFLRVANVKVPDTSSAIWLENITSQMGCEAECLRNCACSAYMIVDIPGKGSTCLTWHGELMDTNNLDDGDDIFVRVDAIELVEHARKSMGVHGVKGLLVILLPSVALAWFVIVIVALLWVQRKRRNAVKNRLNKRLLNIGAGSSFHLTKTEHVESKDHTDLACFDLASILVATNHFSPANKIGQGGFGPVYKGRLSSGQEVAVKRLSENSEQGIEEFETEILLIAKLQHRNLVKLIGCCFEGNERILIYEYLPNKSLDLFLFDQTRKLILVWRKRFNIIVGIARGILYLHQDSGLRIIHRDLKTSNILLDAELNPKISDFGMARIPRGEQIQDKTNRVVGTYGYMSPEYAVFGKYSVKSDVFSFGVIILEIICGKKSHGSFQEECSLTLIGQVWDFWKEGKALEILDSCLKESCDLDEVLRCIQIGLLCVQEDKTDRPTMLSVVLMLNSNSALPPPKQPAFVFQKSYKNPNPSDRGSGSFSVNEVTMTEVICR